ncbi:uncharacterized protein WM277_022098 isoform 2-T4 [Molossus nigricans]
MPTFSGQLRSHPNPSSRRPGGGHCNTLPVALHEGSVERVSPSPRHPRRRRRGQAPSLVSLKPPLPAGLSPLGPPPTPRGPFQTPWARGGCSGRKRWPRLGPGRRGSERGGGGAPGTVSPATRRGRARRDAGSSRNTAGVRRRWQRKPRDRSITGSHGARAFSSLGAGASAGTRPRGVRSRRPSLPVGWGDVRSRGGVRAALVLFLRNRLVLTPLLPRPGREGAAGGDGSFLRGVGGQTGWCSDCSRRRSKDREQQHHEFQFPGARRRRRRRRRHGHDMSQAFFLRAWRSPPPARRTSALPARALAPRRRVP